MGDISEIRGLITVISFFGVTVLLISLIPPQLFVGEEYEGLNVIPPEVFEGIDIQAFLETWNCRMNASGGYEKGGGWYMMDIEAIGENDFGGHTLDFWYKKANQSTLEMYINHWYAEWIFFLVFDGLTWINHDGIDRGLKLSADELDTDYEESQLRYTAKCKHLEIKVFFGFNETAYSTPTEAWNHNGLWILAGINFDQADTGYNAWDLISMLLFFQLPNVHWFLNAIIAIPLWICIAYLAFILILRAIGAIFGGGA